jgi:isoleucyl-tRNA synthetase
MESAILSHNQSSSSLLSGPYRPKEIEARVRNQWKGINVKLKIDNKFLGRTKVGYVEGPPTLNGLPHMGHFRGRLMKDLWYRFSTLRGEYIDFRGGWDCQGLPVELEAEKELGLSGNKSANLKRIGEEKLVETCKAMLRKYHDVWKQADDLLGLMIDDSKAYWTYKDDYIEREWQYLRAGWEHGILDEGFRVTPFCPSCQTSLSASEVALGGYQNLEDPSMYFKVRVNASGENLFLLLWTTMPFTVITDELVGVKPDEEYSYVRVPSESGVAETWIVASKRADPLLNSELRIKEFTIEKRVKGNELAGLRYEYPFPDLVPKQREIEQKSPLVHTIVAEDFVDITTGSGLVHMSPANGEDDFSVSQSRGVPVFNPIDEQANFNKDAGAFSGQFLRDADEKVRDALSERGLLLRYGKIRHEYPICWRSEHRLLWLARREYFYFVDRLGDKAVDAASSVDYFYEEPRNRFVEIVKEKRPWCISRERVWGNPLPIWRCQSCGKKLGLFSRKEIVENAKSLPDGPEFELHKPWIDRVTVACPQCGSEMYREPFVLDTWHNSGASPYASFTDEEFKEYFPVPFLVEAIDQTRGWAYSLLLENVILKNQNKSPYRSFLFYGFVLNEKGEKMSKSKGNFIGAIDVLGSESVDVARFYLTWKATPIDSMNFSLSEMNARPYQVLNTLYHMHIFFLQNSRFDNFNSESDILSKRVEDLKHHRKDIRKHNRWLLSRVEALVDIVTQSYSSARYEIAARAIENFLINELSQTYVPIVRNELWQDSQEARKWREEMYVTLGFALFACDKLLHPISPFLTDFLAKEVFGVSSLLVDQWPESKPEFREERLESEFDLLIKFLSVTNSARMKAKLKRRWPLRRAFFLSSEAAVDLVSKNKELLGELANVLEIEMKADPTELPLKVSAKPNYETLAPRAKKDMPRVANGISRADAARLYNQISREGKATLPDTDFELGPLDVQFSFEALDPKFVVAENFGTVVLLDTSRDEELIAEGLVRDLARNLQALRKEKGFNPTDYANRAVLAGLDEKNLSMLKTRREELAFLVRAKEVVLLPATERNEAGMTKADIDGTEVYLDVS